VVTNPFGPAVYDTYVRQVADQLRLFVLPGQVVELRALDAVTESYRRPHIASGFFDADHLEDMARHALELSGDAKGVYFTLNPLKHDLLSRCYNRVADATTAACDNDVLRRDWLLIDIDPVRVAGVSSTNEERAASWAKAVQVRDYLGGLGWPAPLLADSGNGFHLVYPISLPADDGGLVKRALHALADRFDDERVQVDRAVYNPARIVKLYGTPARKGDSTPERPHRWSGLLEVPGPRQAVPLDKLAALAATAPAPAEGPPAAPGADGPHPPGAVESRARAYLEQLPPAVSGDHGHDRTFHAASVLTQGFAMTPEQALPLLRWFNAEKCQPKWTDHELLHKLQDAAGKEGPRGFLLGPAAAGGPQAPGGFRADFLDCSALAAAAVAPRWLVTKALVADQPAVVGGPKKALKTSIVIDLAVSLASGRPFLREFQVPHPVPVLMLSGESGKAAVLDTAKRVCQAKGLEFRQCAALLWGFQLPRLSSAADLATLSAALRARGVKAVILDPLYLCLLAGGGEGRQAANLFDMGPLLLDVAEACLGAGATPVLVHHARKQSQATRGRDCEPLDLEDLAYSGVAEFARQWLLLSRREKFDPELGEHKLWLALGGSSGHAGLYGVDVREGAMDASFGGRQWRVTVRPASQAIQASLLAKEEQKQKAKAARRAADEEKVMEALGKFVDGRTAPDIAEASGVGVDTVRVILNEQLQGFRVFRCKVAKTFGTGKKAQQGWLLWRKLQRTFTDEQYRRLREGEFVEDVLGVEAVDGYGNVQPKEGG
jgi:hypothetical protein